MLNLFCRCFGTTVYVGLISDDGREVAVKRMVKDCLKTTENEVDILVKLASHDNIVSYKVKLDILTISTPINVKFQKCKCRRFIHKFEGLGITESCT